jgi:cytochrome c-type biogenesis protein CcmH/NrfF
MMPTTGPQMMFGMGVSMLLWIVPAMLLSLLVIGACVWLILRLLKKQGISPEPTPQYEEPQVQYPQIVSSEH